MSVWLINRLEIIMDTLFQITFFALILITFSFVASFVYRRQADGLTIIFILLRVDSLLVCLSSGPITVIIALILATMVEYSSQ